MRPPVVPRNILVSLEGPDVLSSEGSKNDWVQSDLVSVAHLGLSTMRNSAAAGRPSPGEGGFLLFSGDGDLLALLTGLFDMGAPVGDPRSVLSRTISMIF